MHDAYLACHAICINPGYRGQLRAEKPSWALTCAHSCRRRGRALKRKRHNLFAFRTHGLREYSVLADGHRGAAFSPAVVLSVRLDRYYGRLRRRPGRSPTSRLDTGYRTPRSGESPQSPGRGRPPLFPPSPSQRSAPSTPRSSSRLNSRLYTASMAFTLKDGARLSLDPAPHGHIHTRQASLNAADRSVAPPYKAFDTALRRRTFPDAAVLPGPLAAPDRTHTGWQRRAPRIGPRVDIAWLCAPRWYGDAVFATLTGGDSSFCVTPTGRFAWGRHYEERSLIWGNAGRRRFPRPDSTSDTAAKPSASCRPDRSRRSRGAPRGRALLPSVHRA